MRPRQARYQAALRPDMIEFYSSLICEFVDSEPVARRAPRQNASARLSFRYLRVKVLRSWSIGHLTANPLVLA